MFNETLEAISRKFSVDLGVKPPIVIQQVNRTIMARFLAELNFKIGAEIGVAQGNHAKTLCEHNPNLKLYAVDVWKQYDGYNEYENRTEKYFELATETLKPYNCELIRKFSMDAVKDFKDNSLDFVYIDGGHDFKNATDDICEWSKKVRVGGIVFGHDYKGRSKGRYVRDVKYVVQAYCYAKDIRPWFVLDNRIEDPVFGHDVPAWMFVRQEGDRL